MASSTRVLRQASGLLLRDCAPKPCPSHRAFSIRTRIAPIATRQHLLSPKTPSWQQVRKFTRSTKRYAAVDSAPRPEAYLESGAVEPGKNLVGVSKVIVIGSGGLSIGQAGEFDYSGELSSISSAKLARALVAAIGMAKELLAHEDTRN